MATFVAGVYVECMKQGLIVESKDFSKRVVTVTHGLDQNFLRKFDYKQLEKHINLVLEWHKEGHKTYISPSFAMVQSSGMGKTKLMREYSIVVNKDEESDIECKMILCMKRDAQHEPPNFEESFSEKLLVPGQTKFTEDHVEDIKLSLIHI